MMTVRVAPDGMRATMTVDVATQGVDTDEALHVVVQECSARLDEAFASGVRQVLWRAEVGDERSRRVAWACGFTFEGSLRGDWVSGSSVSDSWLATLLAADSREPKTRWLEPVRLTGPGVVLRDQEAADETRYVETMVDPVSLQWLGTLSLPRSPEDFRSMLARRSYGPSTGTSVTWTVAEPATDRYLASVSLFSIGGIDYKSAEVGYRTHPDARRTGVLRSALRLVIAHAFTPESDGGIGLERISLGAGDTNLGSQGVARSCGFVETGRDRRCYDLYDGSVVDLVRFDLLRSEADV